MDVTIMENNQFKYDPERTVDQNFNDWFYLCNDERETWGEEQLDRDDAFALFQEFFKNSIKNG
jgi:hypothetical protein